MALTFAAPHVVERPRDRFTGPDVTRAIALAGVAVMNYHGYLNGVGAYAGPGANWAERLFDIHRGVLATRFAATFVVVAGIGIALMTDRVRVSGDRAAIGAMRLRLVRRGMLLYAGGFLLDWIWPGTILFFYGAYFMIGALLFTLRDRWIAVAGLASALAAAAIQWWGRQRALDGIGTDWLFGPRTLDSRSPRGLLFDTFVNGTHPVLPWLAFLCAGILVGRRYATLPRLIVTAAGVALVAVSYLINSLGSNAGTESSLRNVLLSTRPFDRGLLFTASALGSALVAVCLVSVATERMRDSGLVRMFAHAGQMTLTLYLAHVLVFNLLVGVLGAVQPTGLDTALTFAFLFWLFAIPIASGWVWMYGRGPLERVYRWFGG